MGKKNLKINLPTKLRPFTDQKILIYLVGKNYRPFGDHLPTKYIKNFWSVNGCNLVGNYRPFGDHLPTKFFRSVNGRKIVGNGLSVNGR